VDHKADWWLGDLTHPWFLELERAIHDEWGAEPMRVREGGVRTSFLPSLPFPPSLKPLSPAQVCAMYTVPRKSLWLYRAPPPDGPKLGAFRYELLQRLGYWVADPDPDPDGCPIGSSSLAE
jgi:hypothetical protein